MEMTVQANNSHNDHVARQSQKVQCKEDNEEDKPVLPTKAGEAFEEELSHKCGVL